MEVAHFAATQTTKVARSLVARHVPMTTRTQFKLNEAGVLAALEGRRPVYVYGEINYVDAFDVPRWTKYRLTHRGPARSDGEMDLAPCEDGNRST